MSPLGHASYLRFCGFFWLVMCSTPRQSHEDFTVFSLELK